jgi:preprotein translocase subunit SecA
VALAEAVARYEGQCALDADIVRAAGGLCVLGTERHDSRRIDNQLRGRSGRQGDPGESRFYLSLEDDLMRLFATGAVSWVMDRAMPDDIPLEAKMVSRSIERAQTTVEGRNAEIRKEVLKYDEVMNEQRKVIYGRRMQVIEGEDIHDATLELIGEVVERVVREQLVSEFNEEWDLKVLHSALQLIYPTSLSDDTIRAYEDREDVVALAVEDALSTFEKKCADFPGGDEVVRAIERDVMLQVIDTRWREHLSDMDYLREGIHLRQNAQQDPLTAWQREGYEMFERLLDAVNEDYVRVMCHFDTSQIQLLDPATGLPLGGETNAAAVQDVPGMDLTFAPGVMSSHPTAPPSAPVAEPRVTTPEPVQPPAEGSKIGRNEPCWCGSGRKFKQCHGRP